MNNPTPTDILMEISGDADLFHAPNGTAYADIDINGHRETYAVASKSFEEWLQREFYRRENRPVTSTVLKSVKSLCEAMAKYDKPERKVFVRCASHDGKIYLDLCDKHWRAVEIGKEGWKIITNPPVRFVRSQGLEALPEPERGGHLKTLRGFLNFKSEGDYILFEAWLVNALTEGFPYAVLALSGEQGSAKSTAAKIAKKLIDPNSVPLRSLPKDDRDLFIAANNGHVLAFDNISKINPLVADSLCRLSTGGGNAQRALYTDREESLIDATKPIIVNGIEDIIDRPDLADRALFLTLGAIPEAKRRNEREFWTDFERERPTILGALLDILVIGLRNLPSTKLKNLPRMADFATWATACEPAAWEKGAFNEAYDQSREEAFGAVIESDPVATAVQKFVTEHPKSTERTQRTQNSNTIIWEGTAGDLLEKLSELVTERIKNSRSWPSNGRALSGRLKRATPALRAIGIGVEFHRGSGRGRSRLITLSLIKPQN